MNKQELEQEIKLIELKLENLPQGSLVYKNINNKIQPYIQWTKNGKTFSNYVKKEDLEQAKQNDNLKKELAKQLKSLKIELNEFNKNSKKQETKDDLFKTNVIIDQNLKKLLFLVSSFKSRNHLKTINNYLYSNSPYLINRVCILYGLRRTGKTTLIKQAIINMSEEQMNKTAYIEITDLNTLSELNHDLKLLNELGYQYVFIDEVTLLDDFIDGSRLLSDIFVGYGMKLVLSGTDSLGFYLAEDDSLYDRTVKVHTTFIPYHEFECVLGIKGIDNYIAYGGTMSIEKNYYNKNNVFKNKKSIDEYVDKSIAHNLEHSLAHYQNGTHFRALEELYLNHELTSVTNRIVEDINHRFTIDVLTKDFISHDLGISKKNLSRDSLVNILEEVNIEKITNGIKEQLEILNKDEQNIPIKEVHRYQIEEYLEILDIVKKINIEFLPYQEKKEMVLITQPGLRYNQAKILIEELMKDPIFLSLNYEESKIVKERILNEIRGRMLEEIILLETSIKYQENSDIHIFKLQFARGEFDMVVQDTEHDYVDIYEIKYSEKKVEEQYKNLIDETKCESTRNKYGPIRNKIVLYRGNSQILSNGIQYINVEEYLNNLYND